MKIRPPSLRSVVLTAAGAALGIALAAAGIALWRASPPPLEGAARLDAGLVLRARDGSVLRVVLNGSEDDCRPLAAIDRECWLAKAIVAAEDKRFWEHTGVDPLALLRAAAQNTAGMRRVSGASTLTMQVVRLIEPRPRTLVEKAIEAVRAVRLERALGKERVLLQYLNRAPFGSNLVGAGAGAQAWFGKDPEKLSLAEAALLAGLVQSPERWRPDRHPDAALRRREYVLRRMLALGQITPEQAAAAGREPLALAPQKRPFRAPYYCDWFLKHLPRRRGETSATGEITTPLDPRLQDVAGRAVNRHAAALGCDAAVVIVENATARVAALACSGDYFATGTGGGGYVNTADAPRSAGSALKPFLFALALDRGLLAPEQTLADVPRFFGNNAPANFDGAFRGPVRADAALILSLNIPFIDLLQKTGVAAFHRQLRALGLRTLTRPPAHYGLGLAIGNAPVRLVELARAYAALAQAAAGGGGSGGGTGTGDTGTTGGGAFSPAGAWLVSDILSGPERSADALGHAADARLPRLAWKTGTSAGAADVWTVAWNPALTVAVWCGRKNGRPLPAGHTGLTTAAPLAWAVFRELAATGAGTPWFAKPPAVITRRVCAESGLPPSRHCPETRDARAIAGVTAVLPCDWHRAGGAGAVVSGQKSAVSGQWPVVSGQRPVVSGASPDGLRGGEGETASSLTIGRPPLVTDHRPPTTVLPLRIVQPADGTRYVLADGTTAQAAVVKISGVGADEPVWWFVNGVQTARTTGDAPFVLNLTAGEKRVTAATPTRSVTIRLFAEEI
ncbi:MAG: penicillin-binding protein 1C [Puniceicoccales bacterium]|nr:penicillin-binding protein 1C [Puniceicoccales bacterium]